MKVKQKLKLLKK